MDLYSEEPDLGPWTEVDLTDLVSHLRACARRPVVLVDGRGGAGKTFLAALVADRWPGAAVVHADDLAWHEPLFGWAPLLDELLGSVREGGAVRFRPPQWDARGRTGAIEVPAEATAVLVEGTGAVSPRADARIWVQSDRTLARRRALERDVATGVNGDPNEAAAFWADWEPAEREFLARHAPWDAADVVVLGTPADPPEQGRVVVSTRRASVSR